MRRRCPPSEEVQDQAAGAAMGAGRKGVRGGGLHGVRFSERANIPIRGRFAYLTVGVAPPHPHAAVMVHRNHVAVAAGDVLDAKMGDGGGGDLEMRDGGGGVLR